ncbi:MAG: hypothetical protein RIT45_887 [Pseudomonadota bacterium]
MSEPTRRPGIAAFRPLRLAALGWAAALMSPGCRPAEAPPPPAATAGEIRVGAGAAGPEEAPRPAVRSPTPAKPPPREAAATARPLPPAALDRVLRDAGQRVWVRVDRVEAGATTGVHVGWAAGAPSHPAEGPLTLRLGCRDDRDEHEVARVGADGLFHGRVRLSTLPCLLTLRVPDVGTRVLAVPLERRPARRTEGAFRLGWSEQVRADVRCEPVAEAPLRRGESVEVEVEALAPMAVRSPVAGRVARAGETFARGGANTTAGEALLTLLPDRPVPRDGVPAPWRPAGPDDAPTSLLALHAPDDGVVAAVQVRPGARVRAGAPLLQWGRRDALGVGLPLQARELGRLGLSADASAVGRVDLVLTDEVAAPLVLEAELVRVESGYRLVAALPPGHGLVMGQRTRALLRFGAANPTLSMVRAAAIRRGAERWVFEAVGAEAFVRREVALGEDGGDRFGVLDGVAAGACVVVSGHEAIEAALAAARATR